MSKTDTRAKDTSKAEEPDGEEPTAAAESDEPDTEDAPEAAEEKPAAKAEAEDEPEPAAAEKKPEPKKPEPEKAEPKKAVAAEKTEAGGRTWRGVPVKTLLVRAVVAVAVVGSAVTAGLQWHDADQAAQRDQDRQEVRASAAEFGQALLSYDHTKLQEARHRVLSLASDDFAKTYDEAFTGGLEGVISKLKADATADVQNVYLGEIEDGTAKAVVVVDSEVHSTAGTRRVRGSYLDMRLVRRGGEWKITDVTSIGAANESMVDPQGNQQKPGDDAPAPEKTP